ncbi:MAG: hypothetical protein ACYCT9_12745 [Leptospirillum sp.]
MKARIIGRMIVLGTILILAAACNPMTSSLGMPDFLRGHTYTYEAKEPLTQFGYREDWKIESGLACQNAMAKAERANGENFRIKKIEVTAIVKDGRIVSTKCRVKI